MTIEKHAITAICGADLLPLSQTEQSDFEETREGMEEMKAEKGTGAFGERTLAALKWGDDPLWDVTCGGWNDPQVPLFR